MDYTKVTRYPRNILIGGRAEGVRLTMVVDTHTQTAVNQSTGITENLKSLQLMKTCGSGNIATRNVAPFKLRLVPWVESVCSQSSLAKGTRKAICTCGRVQ